MSQEQQPQSIEQPQELSQQQISHIDNLLKNMAGGEPQPAGPAADDQPQATEQSQPEQQDEPKRDKAANLQAALHEERARRKELQDRLAALESRWAESMQRIGSTEDKQLKAPDPDVDPLGAIEYQQQQIAAKLQQMEQAIQTRAQAEQHVGQIAAMQAKVANDEAEFAKSNPGYRDAAEWVVNRRRAELEAMGLQAPEVSQVIAQEAMLIAARAYQQGDNPAKLIYQMANKLGWKPQGQQGKPQAAMSLAEMAAAPSKADIGPSDDLSKLSDTEFNQLFKRLAGG